MSICTCITYRTASNVPEIDGGANNQAQTFPNGSLTRERGAQSSTITTMKPVTKGYCSLYRHGTKTPDIVPPPPRIAHPSTPRHRRGFHPRTRRRNSPSAFPVFSTRGSAQRDIYARKLKTSRTPVSQRGRRTVRKAPRPERVAPKVPRCVFSETDSLRMDAPRRHAASSTTEARVLLRNTALKRIPSSWREHFTARRDRRRKPKDIASVAT